MFGDRAKPRKLNHNYQKTFRLITKIKRLLLFGDTISVYFDNRKSDKLSVWFVEFQANCNAIQFTVCCDYSINLRLNRKCCCPVQCAGWAVRDHNKFTRFNFCNDVMTHTFDIVHSKNTDTADTSSTAPTLPISA